MPLIANLAERAAVGGVRLLRRWRRRALKRVEQFERKVVTARREFLNLVAEGVVGDYRGNGGKKAGRGGDQRLGNAGRNRAQGSRARRAQPLKGVNDAPDGAEQADEGRNRAGGGQPGHAALQPRHLLGSRNLRGALNGRQPQRPSALAAVLVVGVLEDAHQRAGLELLRHGGYVLDARGLAEGAHKAPALRPRPLQGAPLGQDDGPGEYAEGQQDEQYYLGYQAGLLDQVSDLATHRGCNKLSNKHLRR